MPPRRRRPGLKIEKDLWARGYQSLAGLDEAGRGCLAGPVIAAAVILPTDCRLRGLDDSKKLTPIARKKLFVQIHKKAVSIGVGVCSVEEIDCLNILWAAMEAMRRAVLNLSNAPDYLLVDGNHCFPDSQWPWQTVVKGDEICASIAAASVIAKVTRDRMMVQLHEEFPHYGWADGKGYATPAHYAGLEEHGISKHHRRSFQLVRPEESDLQMQLDF